MKYFLSIILLSALLSTNTFAQQRYEVSTGIDILNRDNNRSTSIGPEDDLQFEIIEEGSWYYRIRVYNSDGSLRNGDFISAKSNIDNAFVYANVINNFEDTVAALTETGEPPTCHLCEQEDEEATQEMSESCDIPGTTNDWRRKCRQLYNSNIPQAALDYALRAMKLNATSFRTNKCFDSQGIMGPDHYSMHGLTANELENDLLAEGLPNKCQMIINDTDDRSPSSGGDDCRGRMYYIDLCQGDNAVVQEDYFNLGTGTCRGGGNGFRNGSGIRTTVKGVFFTHTETFDFAKNNGPYNEARRRVQRAGGPREATALQLFGLQNTNNLSSSTAKYIHISPYRSSFGCPSIAPENYYMIEALANNGPAMVLNWGREGMEDLEACTE